MSLPSIEVRKLFERIQQGERLEVVDCRTPAEFRSCHATVARNMPLESLDVKKVAKERAEKPGEPLYVICGSGVRSTMACEKLAAAGVKVVNVEGGTSAWTSAGLPVVRGRKVIPVDRQMRIVAGLLVVAGVALATVYPMSIYLSGFVGVGLVFSGVTGICPMMAMISRMPWNQGTGGAACPTAPAP